MTTTSSTSSSTSTAATTSTSSTSTSSSAAKSNSSIGQSILTSLNASGSGIDTDSLITNLTTAQKASLEDPITAKQTANAAQISSVGTIASDLSTFSSSLNTLISGGSLQTQPNSSNTNVMTVAAIAGTPVGALSSTITVNALATAQTTQSGAYLSGATFNAGTLSLNLTASGTTVPVTISASSTLSDIAKAINAQATGYTASVVAASGGKQTLVIKGASGAAQAFTLSAQATDSSGAATGDPSSNSLAALYAGTDAATLSQGFTVRQSAVDADLTVDGVEMTRATNNFSDVIPGVQMTLTGTGTMSLGSTRPTSAITEAVNDFVSAYNSVLADINTATAAATSSASAGPLRGNSTIVNLRAQLQKLTTTALNSSGKIRTLAELGVKTAQDGTLSLDSTQLSNMLANYPDDVESMFITTQSSNNAKVQITSTAGTVASGVYAVTGIQDTTATGTASGTLNGAAMDASIWNLTSNSANGVSGLILRVMAGSSDSATITINQGLAGALQSIKDQLTGTNGAITQLQATLNKQKSSLDDALAKAEDQLTTYHDQLVTKFTQMNTLVSGYKATQSYLTQQVDLWTKSSS